MQAQKQKLTFSNDSNKTQQSHDSKMFQSMSSVSSDKRITKTKGFKIKNNKRRKKKISVGGGLSSSIYSNRIQKKKKRRQNLNVSQKSFYRTGNFLNFNTLSNMSK